MPTGDILFRDTARDLALERSDAPSADFVELLASTHWGTHGLRYVMDDVNDVVARMPPSHFLTLRQAGRAVATLALEPRNYAVSGVAFRGYYRSLLAVDPRFHGQGFGKLITEQERRHFLDESRDPVFLYGIVEEGNQRSMNLQRRLGYESILTFELTNFGYLHPRRYDGIEPLQASDVPAMRTHLERFYAHYVMGEFELSLLPSEYWVVRRGDAIVAGAQVVPRTVTVTQLEGIEGKILVRASPILSRLTPVLQTKARRFLWFGNLFYAGADAAPLQRLLEGLLHRFGTPAGALYSDLRSPLYETLRRAGLGLLHKLIPSQGLCLMVGHKGLPQEVLTKLRAGPVVFSPLDCT